MKETATNERKKVSDELHAARVEAEASSAWMRKQQEELTHRMMAASVSPTYAHDPNPRQQHVGAVHQILRPPVSLPGQHVLGQYQQQHPSSSPSPIP